MRSTISNNEFSELHGQRVKNSKGGYKQSDLVNPPANLNSVNRIQTQDSPDINECITAT